MSDFLPPDWSLKNKRPTITCLCGSTRFSQAFHDANLRETLAGNIVLTIGCDMRSDAEIFAGMNEAQLREVKEKLDALHREKIKLADEILVLNVDHYEGESTRSEIQYAAMMGKPIRWLLPPTLEEQFLTVYLRGTGTELWKNL